MANALYPKWKQALIDASTLADLAGSGTSGVYAALVDLGTYTYSAAHQFYSDLSGIVGTPVELASGKTFVSGLFDADDIAFASVSGVSVEAIVLYRKNSGANTTWRLIGFFDTGVTGLPVTPNGGNINVAWNASGIFQL